MHHSSLRPIFMRCLRQVDQNIRLATSPFVKSFICHCNCSIFCIYKFTKSINVYLWQFLPTAYVVRREGYVLTCVCPSVYPHLGGYPDQVQAEGCTLARSRWGYPDGGYPISSTPHWTWPGGTLTGGTPPQVQPHQTWLGGTPPSDLAGGYPDRGYPTSGTPTLSDLARRGTPTRGGVPHLGST